VTGTPLWHGGHTPLWGPLPPYPPLHTDRVSFGGDNSLNQVKLFLGKNCPFLGIYYYERFN